MAKFTHDEVTAAIEAVVAEKGEAYTYPNAESCVYGYADGTPGCIVGHVVARLDPDKFARVVQVEQGVPRNSWPVSTLSTETIHRAVVVVTFDDLFDQVTLNALAEAQAIQDRGRPWGQALVAYYNA